MAEICKPTDDFVVVEGVSGRWHYHLSPKKDMYKPLCGAHGVMSTSMRLDQWGYVGHLHESYCSECEKIAKEMTDGTEK